MRASAVAVVAMAAVLVPVGSALADFRTVIDPNDTGGRLDIASVRQGHSNGEIRYKVVTHDDWNERDLSEGRFVFRFNTDDDARYDRRLTVRRRDGRLVGLIRDIGAEVIRRAEVSHLGGDRLVVWLDRGDLGSTRYYEVDIRSEWRSATDHVDSLSHRLWPLCGGLDPTIVGTPGDDTIVGTRREDVVLGRAGDDSIRTRRGNDKVCSSDGNDVVDGGRYSDQIFGGAGDDTIWGRGAVWPCNDTPGQDCPLPTNVLHGQGGDDHLYGGSDRDYLYGGSGYDTLDGGARNDHCFHGEVKQRC